MGKELLLRLIQEKSKKTKIPYQNLLVGSSKEWILERLFSESKIDSLYLKRSSQIGLLSYSTGCHKALYFSATKPLSQILQELQDIFDSLEVIKNENELEIIVQVPFDKLNLGITMHISSCEVKKAQTYTLFCHLIYENEKIIEIPCFYPEAELAEYFCVMYNQMELFLDVEVLEIIYVYATTKKLNGKYLSIYLEEELNKQEKSFTEEKKKQFFEALQVKALQKRYKGYLRSQKRVSPSFEEIECIMKKLFEPVLDSMAKQEIFFGDWIPELERYL